MDFDSISKKIKSVAANAIDETEKMTKSVVKKSGNLVEQTKLKFALSDVEEKIKDEFSAIGKFVYNQHLAGADFTDELGEHCSNLDSLNNELNDIKAQIAETRNSVICSNCESVNSVDNQFCSKCGNKL